MIVSLLPETLDRLCVNANLLSEQFNSYVRVAFEANEFIRVAPLCVFLTKFTCHRMSKHSRT